AVPTTSSISSPHRRLARRSVLPLAVVLLAADATLVVVALYPRTIHITTVIDAPNTTKNDITNETSTSNSICVKAEPDETLQIRQELPDRPRAQATEASDPPVFCRPECSLSEHFDENSGLSGLSSTLVVKESCFFA